MKWLVSFLLLCSSAQADFGAAELKEVSIDYRRFHDGSRHPLLVGLPLKEGIDVNLKFDILQFFGWDNTIEAITDPGQYRTIALQTRAYLRLSESVEVGWWHRSQHLLDKTYEYDKFPSADAVELRIIFFRDRSPRKGIWP